MNYKRFGPPDAKNVKPIDVDLDVFREYKSLEDLKKEPGKVFGHLSQAAQDAAYEELAIELGLPKATATTTPVAQAAKPVTAASPAQ
jgi:hypothetical protein